MASTKKTTNKSTKSPAPAAKTVRSKKVAAAPAPAALTENPAALAVAALSVAAPPKIVPTKPVTTTITACIDVGFGNALYIRGEGTGLSWDKGLQMNCVGSDRWQITLGEYARPFLVKFLINDVTWSTGPDYTVPSGVSLTLAPQF